MAEREFDVVIYGATGFTGQLTAAYLARRNAAAPDPVRWAIAGRNAQKLESLRARVGEVPTVLADASDPESLAALVGRTRAVVTTVGPYQHYGEPLLAACVEAGTDYLDLCGEPTWMREMLDRYGAAAVASGARIVFSCGFDSVPFDLGVFFLQQEARKRFGTPLSRVRCRVRGMSGTMSGGTAASGRATMQAVEKDPRVRAILLSPFGLTPGFEGPPQPTGHKPLEEPDLGSWSAPFMMAVINTKNVHRSNALLGHAYGEDFVYDEMVLTGPGPKGQARAEALAAMDPTGGKNAPKPGEGPSAEEQENGHYDLLFVGEGSGHQLRVGVTGDKDPGYGSTAGMLVECAWTLLRDATTYPGGIVTPAPIFGLPLVERLRTHAGLTFEVES